MSNEYKMNSPTDLIIQNVESRERLCVTDRKDSKRVNQSFSHSLAPRRKRDSELYKESLLNLMGQAKSAIEEQENRYSYDFGGDQTKIVIQKPETPATTLGSTEWKNEINPKKDILNMLQKNRVERRKAKSFYNGSTYGK